MENGGAGVHALLEGSLQLSAQLNVSFLPILVILLCSQLPSAPFLVQCHRLCFSLTLPFYTFSNDIFKALFTPVMTLYIILQRSLTCNCFRECRVLVVARGNKFKWNS